MLLIDGVKYELWIPPSEEEFERVVKEHAQDIFGKEAEFFNKQRLESELGKGSVPDGFVIIFGASSRWYIIETELSVHDVHKHIVEQHSRFIMGVGSSETKNKIVKAIYNEIDKDASRKQKLKKAIDPDEIYRFLHEVISKPPVLTIIVEKPIKGLDETLKALSRDTISDIKVVEFQTFIQEGVGLGVHAHLFEPIYRPIKVLPTPVVARPGLPVHHPQALSGAIKVRFETAKTAHPFYLLRFEKQDRGFLPGYKQEFTLETNIGETKARVTSAQGNPISGDSEAGTYITGSLGEWAKQNPQVKSGDILTLIELVPKARYRLA
jgi:hypothetical protein